MEEKDVQHLADVGQLIRKVKNKQMNIILFFLHTKAKVK